MRWPGACRAVRWRVVASAPWRRAPLLLFRYPGTALAVAGAGAVVAFVAASWPLFLGSVVVASQDRQVAQRCAAELGATVTPTAELVSAANPARARQLAAFDAAVAEVAAATPGLGRVTRTRAVLTTLVAGDRPGRTVRVLARDGADGAAAVTAGAADGTGLLVPERTYRELGLAPGSPVRLVDGPAEVGVPVAGAYHPPAEPLPEEWCSERTRLVPQGVGEDPPPPVVLVDHATLDRLGDALGAGFEAAWEVAAERPLGVTSARRLAAQIEALEIRLESVAGGRVAAVAPPGAAVAGPAGVVRAVTSTLPFVVRRSRAVSSGLEAGLAPTVAGAAVAGAVLLVAAGWFWSERRAGELAVLRRLGTGPVLVAAKAALELVLPAALGAALGLAGAVAVVTAVGPGGVPVGPDVARAARWVAGAAVAGLVGAAVVASARSAVADRAGGARPPRARRPGVTALRAVPWEVAVLAATLAVLGARGPGLAVGEERLELDSVGFVLPVAVIGSVGVSVGRVAALALGRIGPRAAGLPVAAWLAVRRLAARPVAPALFMACAVTSIGMLVYANGASTSLERLLADKAALAVGADALVSTLGSAEVPADLGRVSPVATVDVTQRSEPAVVLLGVDPATAADVVAFPGMDDGRLRRLLRALDRSPSGAVPAIAVGAIPGDGVVELAATGVEPIRLDVVARLDRFPGMSQARGTVVVDIERLRELRAPHDERLWVRGPVEPVVERLAAAGIEVRSVRVPSQALGTATFLAVVWTFGFVRALAALGGVVAAVGLLVYLDARQRARQLAYGLTRHMGLARRAHRSSIALELAAVVGPATAAGVAAGVAAVHLFVPRLDPLPRFPPDAVAVVPWPVVAAVAAGAVALCGAGAAVGQRAADRVRLATALRHGG